MIIEEKNAPMGFGFGTSMTFLSQICKVNTIKPPMFGHYKSVIYDISKYGTYDVIPNKSDVVGVFDLGTKNKNEAYRLHNELCDKVDELGGNGKNINEIILLLR